MHRPGMVLLMSIICIALAAVCGVAFMLAFLKVWT